MFIGGGELNMVVTCLHPHAFLGAGESSFGSRGSEAVVSGVCMQWLSTSVKWDFTQIWVVCMLCATSSGSEIWRGSSQQGSVAKFVTSV